MNIKNSVHNLNTQVKPKPALVISKDIKIPGLNAKELQTNIKRNPAGELFLSVPDKSLMFAIEHINKVISGVNVELRHELHKASNSIIVTLIDKDTRDVILEIPPQKVLDAFVERMVFNGIYIDERR